MPTPDTILIIPAAGAGTRLQSSVPKVLAPVAGTPMIDHLFDLYRDFVQRFVLVVHPSCDRAVRDHCRAAAPHLSVDFAHQPEPTGMLDAILLAADSVRASGTRRVWITWCDQVGVHPDTIDELCRWSAGTDAADVILPTARQADPYIHIERDTSSRIVNIRQRREGDQMPPIGESDIGLFSLSAAVYFERLPEFSREASRAAETRERNFLPFIPWLSERAGSIVTFPCTDPVEAIGVNTQTDRERIEQYLREREEQ